MRSRIVRRAGVLALAASAVLLAGGAPASAASGDGSAYGIKVDVTLLGVPAVHAGPLAAASTNGPTSDSLASAAVPGVLTAGVINTSAHKDSNTGAVTAAASTADVRLPLLAALGTVGAKVIAAKCVATQAGEAGSATLTDAQLGSLGTLAVNPAPNSTVDVKLPVVGNVARLVLNEQIHNPDGSLTVNAVHLHLLGGRGVGALGDGDVIISSATCGPAGLPMPVASGAGLWIGLGLLGAVAVPVGLAAKRRRASAATAA